MLTKTRTFLGTEVDNSPLVLFRIVFGFLAAAESFGAVVTGWVHETFIDPRFTFTMIGFEWLQPLEGNGMIYYFIIMGIAGLMMMLGLFYRASAFVFAGMWTIVYLMQKSHYNNHYYLLVLMSWVMMMLPAHKGYSLDAKWGFTIPRKTCARICYWFFIIQVVIIYLYASYNKMHLAWIQVKPIEIWFKSKEDFWLIGPLLQEKWFQYFIAWGGIIYDGTIVFLLLHPKTRKIGFVLSVFFNLANSWIFRIGIFPYLMIGLSALFFPPETIRKIFFRKKKPVYPIKKKLSLGWTYVIGFYFIIHLLLPLRQYLYEGNPSWTEEGHRLAWRMMLRIKGGYAKFYVVDKATGVKEKVKIEEWVSKVQHRSLVGQPDMIWQFAQKLKEHYAEQGKDVEVYANVKARLNGGPTRRLIDRDVDLASVPWERFKHSDWILTYNDHD